MKTALFLTIAVIGLALFTLSVNGEDFTYTTNNGTITITGYTGTGGAVTIPETINGLPVTSIGPSAFSDCTSLLDIIVPNGVTAIWDFAFGGCTNLASITLPKTLTTISFYVFARCNGLMRAYFEGNTPENRSWGDISPFPAAANTIYYLPGTIGWDQPWRRVDSPSEAVKAALWLRPHPTILTTNPSLGINTNGFRFTVSWATNASVVVEAASSLSHPIWSPVVTNALTDGVFKFSDPEWRDHSSRFYRVRSQ